LRRNGEIISRALKVPVAETGAGVLALLERTALTERKLKTLEEEAALRRAEALIAGKPGMEAQSGAGKVLVTCLDDTDMDEVLRIGRAAQRLSAAVLVFASSRDLKFAGLCPVKSQDIRPLLKGVMEKHGGKGGGGASFFQGRFSRAEDLAAFLQSISKHSEVKV
jgi:alanyl-tRNA synthetase